MTKKRVQPSLVTVKRLSVLAAASAFLVLANPSALAEDIQVDHYRTQQVTQADVTLQGYITGSLNSSGTAYADAATNLALGQTPDAPAADTVPVQLPKALREDYSLTAHPELKGQRVAVTGTSATYMGKPGIKNTSTIQLLDGEQNTNSSEEAVPQSQDLPAAQGTMPLATVRQGETGETYTVAGKVISKVNAWGGNGFYIQDDSGQGLYVYPKTSLGIKEGDSIQLTGSLSTYHGEVQLGNITESHAVSDSYTTSVTDQPLSSLATAPQGTLVRVSKATVQDMDSDSYNNTDLTLADEHGQTLAVRIDSRSGLQASDLATVVGTGDQVSITGILSVYDGTLQLKPFSKDQIQVLEKSSLPSELTDVTVAEIQGKSHRSPYANKAVTVKNVVVTYVTSDTNFYVQDLNPDGDDATSDGVNVYSGKVSPKVNVKPGDVLTISGVVEEYFGKGYDERKKTDLTITQINASSLDITGQAEVPAPVVLGKDRTAPKDVVDSDGLKIFNPETDAIDFWESIEGMLVEIDDARILGPMKNKEIYVVPGNSDAHFNKVGGITLRPNATNTELIPLLLKNGKTPVKSGDYFTGKIVGPVTYSYTNYKVYVDDATLPELHDGGVTPEKTDLVKDPSKLTIASYNIENFSANTSTTKDSKVERIAKSFVSDLNAPDIVGLIEVQDNNGPTDDGTVDATESANRLIRAIEAQGGPSYKFIDIDPVNNQDGGQAGANIRLGFLYNPERVQLADKPVGGSTDSVAWKDGELTYSVGRIDAADPLWESTRKSIAGEFIFNGQKVVVIANHLNSKRGDAGLYGSVQPVVLASEEKRHKLAQVISDFAKEGLSQNPDTKIVMLGDYNDYEFTPTIQIIENAGMTDVVSLHDESDRFSYFYNGNNQTLDHMIVSNNLIDRYAFDMVHVNSAFMEEHGRASDHDPVMIQLDLSPKTETVDEETTPQEPRPTQPGVPEVVEDHTDAPGTPHPSKEPAYLDVPVAVVTPSDTAMEAVAASQVTSSQQTGQTLPETGDTATYLWTLVGSAFLGLSVFYTNRKKE